MNERRDPTDPRVWLARAQSNLKLAQLGHQAGIFLEDLCFEAQQAAEKALKAICVHHSSGGVPTRYQNLAPAIMTACL